MLVLNLHQNTSFLDILVSSYFSLVLCLCLTYMELVIHLKTSNIVFIRKAVWIGDDREIGKNGKNHAIQTSLLIARFVPIHSF